MKNLQNTVEAKLDKLTNNYQDELLSASLLMLSFKVLRDAKPSLTLCNHFGALLTDSYKIASYIKDYYLGNLGFDSSIFKKYTNILLKHNKLEKKHNLEYITL